MSRRGRSRSRTIELPNKRMFYVRELAEIMAQADGEDPDKIRKRVYRMIEHGRVRTVRYLGTLRIPYEEATRLVRGETL